MGSTTNVFLNSVQYVEIPLVAGVHTYEYDVQGYGIALLECDDNSATIQFDTTNSDPLPLTEIDSLVFVQQFQRIFITNYESLNGWANPIVALLVIKDPKVSLNTIAPYREFLYSMTFAELYMLMASGATSRYYIWTVPATSSTPIVYTDPNQQYTGVPLIQSIVPISIASGSVYTIATTALQDTFSMTPSAQQPIPSTLIPVRTELKIMGYSVIYTPLNSVSGNNIFFLSIQQPWSINQVNQMYNI
jgi:hypothetical protein